MIAKYGNECWYSSTNLNKKLSVINAIITNWTLVVKRDPQQIIKKFDKSIPRFNRDLGSTNLIMGRGGSTSLCERDPLPVGRRSFVYFLWLATWYIYFFVFSGVCKRSKAKASYEIVQALIVDVQWRILKWLVHGEPV